MVSPATPPNGRSGIVGSITKLSETLVTSLPAGFLMIVLLNIAMFGVVIWFMSHLGAERAAFYNKVLDACIGTLKAMSQKH